jgi:hypothetical protein
MTYASEWTQREFSKLLDHAALSDEEMARSLPGRSVSAVATVRAGLDDNHRGGGSGILSEMMLGVIARRRGGTTCPTCRMTF